MIGQEYKENKMVKNSDKEVKKIEIAMKKALETELETFDLITLILRKDFEEELERINPQKSVSIPDRFEQKYKRVSRPKKEPKMLVSA